MPPDRPADVALVASDLGILGDGAMAHTVHLADALRRMGVGATVYRHTPDRTWTVDNGTGVSSSAVTAKAWPEGRLEHDAVLLAYSPNNWDPARGIPDIVALLQPLAASRTRVLLLAHELWVHPIGPKDALPHLRHRWRLQALRRLSDVVLVTTSPRRDQLERHLPHRATIHMPVPSNLPGAIRSREDARALVGARDDEFVVGSFLSGYLGRRRDLLTAALGAIVVERPVLFVQVGATAPALDGLDERVRVRRLGPAREELIASWLASVDLYLMPFPRGASTRRTSLMAGLQHGLATVTTDGPETDAELRESPAIRVVRPEGFVDAAQSLARDPAARDQLGARAARMYIDRYDWPHSARIVAAATRV